MFLDHKRPRNTIRIHDTVLKTLHYSTRVDVDSQNSQNEVRHSITAIDFCLRMMKFAIVVC